MRARNFVKWILIGLGILIVALYGFSKTRDLVFGTTINIKSPHDGQSFNESLIDIEGNVGHVTKLEINGKQVLSDENGNFKKNYALIPGLNRVTIAATDRFERTTYKTLILYYKAENRDVQPVFEGNTGTTTVSTSTSTASTAQTNQATSTKVSTTTNQKVPN